MRINGPTARELRGALRLSYRESSFRQMLSDQLDIEYDDISSSAGNFDARLFEVINEFNRRYEIELLVRAARLSNPTSLDLRIFEEKYVLASGQVQPLSLPDGVESYEALYSNLQQMVTTINMLDPKVWRTKLGQLESRICKVIVPSNQGMGTGFLVGPDLVITNYHVVSRVVDKPNIVNSVKLRFDYALLAEGQNAESGTDYNASEILDYSEFSQSDLVANPPFDAEADKLDYALLRVSGNPSSDLPGGASNKTSDEKVSPRGWIEQPDLAPDLDQPTPIFILQHPQGMPLKLALATNDQVAINKLGTRVRYSTNTMPGSSGSPCFDHNWTLVALHHAGDPAYKGVGLANYNEGIPFTAICALLEQRGMKDLLRQKMPQMD